MQEFEKKQMEGIVKIRIKKEEVFWGNGLVELLDLIKKYSSLKKACEAMNMSYSKGQRIIKKAEKELGFSVVYSSKGGIDGGGTVLTYDGEEFCECYREFSRAMEEYGKDLFQRNFYKYL